MQCAIDSAKRRFDIDMTDEIRRLRNDIDIKNNKYPRFWLAIRKGFDAKKINQNIQCPMNQLYDMKVGSYNSEKSTLPFSAFFIKQEPLKGSIKYAKKIEGMLQKYSLDVLNYNKSEDNEDDYLVMRNDFEELIDCIRNISINKKYASLVSWFINQAFIIENGGQHTNLATTIHKNRALLLKVLYNCNPTVFLSCFRVEPTKNTMSFRPDKTY